MLSSAVVIPEQEPQPRSPSPSLKRRQSSISTDSNKRPKLDSQQSTENGTNLQDGGPASPSHRKRPALSNGAIEEKKRGQRLFGALLGTLSQTTSKPAHRKRDEIEQRQRERLRKDTQEREEERKRKREELDEARRAEQKVWEKESTRIRHRNTRAMASFLQTKTEPRLYYKPWELREEEEEQIKRHVKEVEDNIRNELGIPEPKSDNDTSNRAEEAPAVDSDMCDNEHVDGTQDAGKSSSEDKGSHEPGDVVEQTDAGDPNHSEQHATERKSSEEDKPKDDDHAGEELVEGQEDDVIY